MIAGRLSLIAVSLVLALSGCGSDVDETLTARSFQAIGKSVLSGGRTARVPSLGLTRARLAQLTVPADLVTLDRTGAEAVILLVAANGATETWSSVDDKTLAIRDGQIVGTRGLGGDLVSAALPPLSRIAAGQGTHERVLVTIGADEQTERITYSCTLTSAGTQTITIVQRSHATRRVQESCTGPGEGFTNEYWFEGSTLRQSRQWMGTDLGHILLSRLRS
jgi:Group 4 capsule polysaccharide lipoprotein gfcB, YjbF